MIVCDQKIRLIGYVVFTLLVACLSFSSIFLLDADASRVQAQQTDPTPTSVPSSRATADLEPLRAQLLLGEVDDQVLSGPYDDYIYRFGIPAHWRLTSDSNLVLYGVFFNAPLEQILSEEPEPSLPGSVLSITFNDTVVATVPLTQTGALTLTVPLAPNPSTLRSNRPDRLHELELQLTSPFGCLLDIEQQPGLLIRAVSELNLTYRESQPELDLGQLPWPLYQQTAEPDEALIVVPNNPTAAELQAALAVAAGLGQMTDRELATELVPVDEVSETQRAATHLIVVGRTSQLPYADRLARSFVDERDTGSDGLIEIMVSPWNNAKVVLAISGNDDEAVLKAGQAVSTGQLQPGVELTSARVVQIVPDVSPTPVLTTETTFAEMGYRSVTLTEPANTLFRLGFDLSSDQQIGNDAYLDLIFSHTADIQEDGSTITVRVNDVPLGSVPLDPDDTTDIRERFELPPQLLQTGQNEIVFGVALEALDTCRDPDQDALWLTIHPNSVLFLPPDPNATPGQPTLADYPYPFAADATLQSTVFLLPLDDPAAWHAAGHIATHLGANNQLQRADFQVLPATTPPIQIDPAAHLIVVGQPTSYTWIEDLVAALPLIRTPDGQFVPGSVAGIDYQVASEHAPGLLAMLPRFDVLAGAESTPLPRVALLVLATNAQELEQTAAALWQPQQPLQGVVVLVDNERIIPVGGNVLLEAVPAPDTEQTDSAEPTGTNVERSAEETSTATLGEEPIIATPAPTRPAWILVVIAISTVLMIGVICVAVFFWWRQRRVEL